MIYFDINHTLYICKLFQFNTIKEHVTEWMIFGINSFLRRITSGTKQYNSYYSQNCFFFNTLDANNIRLFYYSSIKIQLVFQQFIMRRRALFTSFWTKVSSASVLI